MNFIDDGSLVLEDPAALNVKMGAASSAPPARLLSSAELFAEPVMPVAQAWPPPLSVDAPADGFGFLGDGSLRIGCCSSSCECDPSPGSSYAGSRSLPRQLTRISELVQLWDEIVRDESAEIQTDNIDPTYTLDLIKTLWPNTVVSKAEVQQSLQRIRRVELLSRTSLVDAVDGSQDTGRLGPSTSSVLSLAALHARRDSYSIGFWLHAALMHPDSDAIAMIEGLDDRSDTLDLINSDGIGRNCDKDVHFDLGDNQCEIYETSVGDPLHSTSRGWACRDDPEGPCTGALFYSQGRYKVGVGCIPQIELRGRKYICWCKCAKRDKPRVPASTMQPECDDSVGRVIIGIAIVIAIWIIFKYPVPIRIPTRRGPVTPGPSPTPPRPAPRRPTPPDPRPRPVTPGPRGPAVPRRTPIR